MTDKNLYYIKVLADEKSFSKAAKKLYIAQPSLSQSVQRLEAELGVKIFHRSTSGLILTQAGTLYYQMACRVLKAIDDFNAEFSNTNDLQRGQITFGINNHYGVLILPQLLTEFSRRFPRIEYFIRESDSTSLDEMLLHFEISFSVMHVTSTESRTPLHYDLLGQDIFIITLPANSPLADKAIPDKTYPYPVLDLAYLKNEPLITVPKTQRIRQVTDRIFTKADITPSIRLTLKNYVTVQQLVAKGFGYTIGPLGYNAITYCASDHPLFFCLERSLPARWYPCIATNPTYSFSKPELTMISLIKDLIVSA